MAFNGQIVRTIGYKLALDDTDFSSSLQQAQSDTDRFNTRLQRIGRDISRFGRQMTTRATVPIVGLGTAAVLAASRFEEANAKFETVFGDQADATRAWAEEQAELINRSSADWVEYLATFQDTFVPLGFAREEAAGLSQELVLLAEDLGSFNNIATADVVRDLQSALVGNTETLRKYGVVAQETQIMAEAINSGLVENEAAYRDLDGAQRAVTRSQAIYNLILQGTTDAQGDALRTAESFANQMKGLQASAQELAISFGQELMPFASELVDRLNNLVEGFSNLDDAQKQAIVRIGLLTASIGPASMAIGGAIRAVKGLSSAVGFLAANPVVAAIAAVAGLTAGVALLGRRARNNALDDLYEDLAGTFNEIHSSSDDIVESIQEFANQTGFTVSQSIDVAEQQGLITDEIREQVEALRAVNAEAEENGRTVRENLETYEAVQQAMQLGEYRFHISDEYEGAEASLRGVKEQAAALSQNLGVGYRTVLDIAIASENISGSYRQALVIAREQLDIEQSQEGLRLQLASQTNNATEQVNEQNRLQEEQNDLLEERNQLERERYESVVAGRRAAADEYAEEMERIRRVEEAGLLEGTDAIEARLTAANTYAQALAELGYNGQRGQVGDDALNQMVSLVDEYEQILSDAAEEEARIEANAQKVNEAYEERKRRAIEAREAAIQAEEEKKQAELQAIEEKRQRTIEAQEAIDEANQRSYERYRDQQIAMMTDPIARLERQRDIEVAEAEERGEDVYWIEQYWADQIEQARQEARDRDLAQQEAYRKQMVASAQEMYSSLQSVVGAYFDYQTSMLDKEMQDELARAGLADETDSERLQGELEDLEEKLKTETDLKKRAALEEERAELEKEIAKQKIADKYAEKKAKLQRKQAEMNKAFAIMDIIINTATAAVKALGAGPIAGPILASMITALGAAQLGLVAATPIPEFAKGGVVQKETQAIIGEAGPEAVIPLRPEVLSQIGEGIASASGTIVNNDNHTEATQQINVYVGEEHIASIVNRGIENRTIRI